MDERRPIAVLLCLCAGLAWGCGGQRSTSTAGAGSPDAGSPGTDSDAGPTAGTDGGTNTDGGTDGGVTLGPPLSKDGWTFYGQTQGLSADIHDVSADEAGNVYVAGDDAVYAKKRGDDIFQRFDADAAGLTKNCDGSGSPLCPTGTTPPGDKACPIISVAGGAPGVAAIGFQGQGTDGDNDQDWCLSSGGADLLSYDGTNLQRTRHVLIASPPGVICGESTSGGATCPSWDFSWTHGRRKLRQVYRIVINHLKSTIQYGDVWMGGTHATFSVLLANAASRGWVDTTVNYPSFADAKDVWEHDHPAVTDSTGRFLTGEAHAIAIDPITGDPWAANEFRAATKQGYGSKPAGWWSPMWPPYNPSDEYHSYWDIWPDQQELVNGVMGYLGDDPRWMDAVMSMSFCDDGTLWLGSALHGLVRRDPSGNVTFLDTPSNFGNSVTAVACDPSDSSLWVGFGWGGMARLKDGQWSLPPNAGVKFQFQPVWSIQIDRWSTPRIVYFAHLPSWQNGAISAPGGVTAFAGP